jgi:hypothetical protein
MAIYSEASSFDNLIFTLTEEDVDLPVMLISGE